MIYAGSLSACEARIAGFSMTDFTLHTLPIYGIAAVLGGVLLDCLLGDPCWLPHPIRLFGNAIQVVEKALNKGSYKMLKGALMWLLLVSSTGVVFFFATSYLRSYPLLLCLFNALFFFYGISNRSLIAESMKVERLLQKNDLDGARKQLSTIVGRDTDRLSPAKIRIAVLETLSENLSDGVVAPLFYYALGGVPLMMAYKMINTLDSMVGYKNERFIDFGYVSAKMDDVANFIPARLTAFLMVLVSFRPRLLSFILEHGKMHSSPNSGYPEAALAGILNCRFGGPNSYFGKIVSKPYIGINERELYHHDVLIACRINFTVALVGYVMLVVIQYWLNN